MGKNGGTTFSGRIGFVLSMVGSAVGLGCLWRFPYLASEYGGGAFMLTYIVLAITFGLTLMLTEVCIGRRTGKNCFEAFESINKRWGWIGLLAALVPAIIVPYYCVIGGWVMKYFFEYATWDSGDISASFFDTFTSFGIDGLFNSPILWFLIFVGLVVSIVSAGVEKGIEKVNRLMMPLLVVMLISITLFVFMMDNALEGFKYYLIPNMDDFNAKTFLAAVGQLFYSMSLAMGITITYGAYLKKSENIERSVFQVNIIDVGVAFLSGLMIVPAVIAVGSSVNSGPGLMFVTMPEVFVSIPGGNFVGLLFFLLVIFAALTSAISLMEALVHILMQKANISRKKASRIVLVEILLLGMLACLGYGPLSGITFIDGFNFLEFFDFLSNSLFMPIVAILTCIFVGFIVGPKYIEKEVESSGEFRTKKLYAIMIRWVCPIGLTIILVSGLLSVFGIMNI